MTGVKKLQYHKEQEIKRKNMWDQGHENEYKVITHSTAED